jgi:hypothetical protein
MTVMDSTLLSYCRRGGHLIASIWDWLLPIEGCTYDPRCQCNTIIYDGNIALLLPIDFDEGSRLRKAPFHRVAAMPMQATG